MSLTPKTDHVAEGTKGLISQFQGQPNLAAFLSSYTAQVQEIEDMLWDLLAIPGSIDDQVGAQLDLWGKIVGQDRLGKSDTEYIRWIKARLIVNRASGLPSDLLAVLDQVVDNAALITDYYPASFVVSLSGAFSGDVTEVAAILTETRAAGVGGGLLYALVEDASAFTFSSGDTEEASSSQGWADSAHLLNGDFDDWTTDDPDEWIRYEALPAVEVSEVGTGESHGGVGTGACNLYTDAMSTSASIRQGTSSLTSGVSYTITVVISAIAGTLRVYDIGAGALFDASYTTAGTKAIVFTAGAVVVFPQLYATTVNSNITIDSVAIARTTPVLGGQFADVEEL